eukprot:PhM_4_TR2059/c0_g1_i7/m.43171
MQKNLFFEKKENRRVEVLTDTAATAEKKFSFFSLKMRHVEALLGEHVSLSPDDDAAAYLGAITRCLANDFSRVPLSPLVAKMPYATIHGSCLSYFSENDKNEDDKEEEDDDDDDDD